LAIVPGDGLYRGRTCLLDVSPVEVLGNSIIIAPL